jgi:DNA-binding phage protein
MNFRQLVDQARASSNPKEPPTSMHQIAERCGVSRVTLYNIIDGAKRPTPWTVAKIAGGLGLSEDEVEASIKKTWRGR